MRSSLIAVLVACALATVSRDAGALSTFPDTLSLIATSQPIAVSAMQLDSSFHPVIVFNSGPSLRLMHCNDTACQGGDDLDSAIPGVAAGLIHQMLLDASERPVVMLIQSSGSTYTLTLLHCGDTACSSGNSVTSLATVQYNGCCVSYGLALDSSGNPLVAYTSASDQLHLIRCNDPNCASNDDPNTVVATGARDSTQIVTDASDFPVIAFHSAPGVQLGVLRCNDIACAGGDDVPTLSPLPYAGYSPALTLDSTGNPVIAHWSGYGLNITHCNDPGCAGGNDPNALAPAGGVIGANVIVLDSAGRPVVVSNGQGGFLVATCGDATRTSGIQRYRARVTPLGATPGFGLDGSDRPIVVIPAYPQSGLWVIHCATEACDTDTDGDGCNDLAELSTGDPEYLLERYGAHRDAKNPNDYFNPTHDGKNRVDDVLAVVDAYFMDDADGNPGLPPYAPGYDPDTDRTLVGPNAWNLGPPDGLQRVDDILNAIHQYFHDCA